MLGMKRKDSDNPYSGPGGSNPQGATSFLPEDYLQRKWESRANTISLLLFGVVLFGVVGAFFVTNRAWNTVRSQQREINAEYTEQTKKIEQLKVLEQQKLEMLDKAEVTTALIERVPRSILLAELINRMPDRLTLTDVEIKSKRIVEAPTVAKTGPKSIGKGPAKPGTAPAKDEAPKIVKPPRIEYSISLIGLATTDEAVADYLSALKDCELLERVDHVLSQASIVNSTTMRKFRLEAQIRPDADARKIAPLKVTRKDEPGQVAGGLDQPISVFDPMDPTTPRPAEVPPIGVPR